MPVYIQKQNGSSTGNIARTPADIARTQRKYTQPKLNPIGKALDLFTPLELGFTLDRSASMQSIWADAVRGFNALLAEQPRTPGVDARFSSSLFNDVVLQAHHRIPLADVQPLYAPAHQPSGNTALLDAIGKMMQGIGETWDAAPLPESVRPRVLIAILTDGAENASVHFTLDKVFREIHWRRLACNWQFLYFCANQTGVSYGLKLGIQRSNIATFNADPAGITALMGRVAKAMTAYALGDRNYQRFLLGNKSL